MIDTARRGTSHRAYTFAAWTRRFYAIVLVAFGAAFLAGGGVLAASGGSVYYIAAGALLAISGVLVWRRDSRAAWVYGALAGATIAWAVYECGASFWGLMPRLDAILVLGLPLLFTRASGPEAGASGRGWSGWAALLACMVGCILLGAALHATVMPHRPDPILRDRELAAAPARLPRPLAAISSEDWKHYGNDAGATRFSPIADITPANVRELKLAWSADTAPGVTERKWGLEVTPINIGDALYLCNAYDEVLALDAETGETRWTFAMSGGRGSGKPCRGVSYTRVPNATGDCSERIIAASQGSELIALDMRSGKPCTDFGDGGRVSLRQGLSGSPEIFYYVSSAPQIIRGKAVVGGAVKDDQFYGEPSGVIRAYDVVTGKLAWAFNAGQTTHEVPGQGQFYEHSTPNSWAPISADEELGLVYLPMGGTAPDYYDGLQKPEEANITSSVVALDAETGAMRWRFQTVHDDVWDYDISAQATLVDLPTPTGVRKALVQPTKTGEVFVLDRQTGRPVMPVEEVPVAQEPTVDGQRTSPTQPVSTSMPTFRGPFLREADMWGLTPLDQMICRIDFKQSLYAGPYTPLALHRWAITQPGDAGGMEWGGVSIDIDRGIAIVNAIAMPDRIKMMTQDEGKTAGIKIFDGKGQGDTSAPMLNTPYSAYALPFVSPLGVPCTQPPWGTLTAIDLSTGGVIWSEPLGTGRDSGPFGIRSHLPFRMGVPNIGGSVTTRGGLVFIGAAADGYLRAFDTASGELLWESRLPGAGTATPLVYRSPKSGRQFVVIAAGGKPGLQTRVSNQIVAYALPK